MIKLISVGFIFVLIFFTWMFNKVFVSSTILTTIRAETRSGKEVIITGDLRLFKQSSTTIGKNGRASDGKWTLTIDNRAHQSDKFVLFTTWWMITSTPSVFKSVGVLSTSFGNHLPIFRVLDHEPAIGPSKHRYLTACSIITLKMPTDLALTYRPYHGTSRKCFQVLTTSGTSGNHYSTL